jgi:hypothetical protein
MQKKICSGFVIDDSEFSSVGLNIYHMKIKVNYFKTGNTDDTGTGILN